MKKKSSKTLLVGWHFCAARDGTPTLRDGTPVVVGETLRVTGPLRLCEHGFHGSQRAIDALRYAPGPFVERVEYSGKIIHDDDKFVARTRRCLALADASQVLHEFACREAEAALLAERAAGREPDPRSFAAIAAKRAWLRGEINDSALYAAETAAEAAAAQAKIASYAADAAYAATWTAAEAAAAQAKTASHTADAAYAGAWTAAEAVAWAKAATQRAAKAKAAAWAAAKAKAATWTAAEAWYAAKAATQAAAARTAAAWTAAEAAAQAAAARTWAEAVGDFADEASARVITRASGQVAWPPSAGDTKETQANQNNRLETALTILLRGMLAGK